MTEFNEGHRNKCHICVEPCMDKRHNYIGHPYPEKLKEKHSKTYQREGNPNWKGDQVSPHGGRNRTMVVYPNLGICEKCNERPAMDRHHINGVTKDTSRKNILLLCRVCHMEIDDRIKRLKANNCRRRVSRALVACGHRNWRQCRVCHKWDDPKNLYIKSNNLYHRTCNAERLKQYTKSYKENAL